MEWVTKASYEQKLKIRKDSEKKRKLMSPYISELTTIEDVDAYCEQRSLSDIARDRIIKLTINGIKDIDWSDQRRKKRKDRVPRSLEERSPTTPPAYWEIDDEYNSTGLNTRPRIDRSPTTPSAHYEIE